MADPIVSPPPPPAPKSRRRTAELAEHGLPHDIPQARKRLARSRVARSKKPQKVPRRTLGLSLPAPLAESVELIAERYGVAISAVQRRMIEDGVRFYGTDEEIDHAGLGEKKPNPFDPMDTAVQPSAYDRYRERRATEAYAEEPGSAYVPPPLPALQVSMPNVFTGSGIPSNPSAYENE